MIEFCGGEIPPHQLPNVYRTMERKRSTLHR